MSSLNLPIPGQELVALIVAVSFAAGLNVYATVATLGILAHTGVLVLPDALHLLASWWVIGASIALFGVEFFADKIPAFDLVWNALHTFIRVPVAGLIAWRATAIPTQPESLPQYSSSSSSCSSAGFGAPFEGSSDPPKKPSRPDRHNRSDLRARFQELTSSLSAAF